MDDRHMGTTNGAAWVTTLGSQLEVTLRGALTWADTIRVVCDGPSSEDGGCSFWRWLFDVTGKLETVFVGTVSESEPALLQALVTTGKCRVPTDSSRPIGNVVWCSRGELVKVFVSSGRLTTSAFAEQTPPWLCFEGKSGELPRGFDVLFLQLATSSSYVSPGTYSAPRDVDEPAVYRRALKHVTCAVPRASLGAGFLGVSENEQTTALWTTLIGEGVLDMDKAVRLAAQRLREQGLLEYQALRQAGELYQLIEIRLVNARRNTTWFDRPKPGHIRAIELNVDQLSAGDWRDCLLSALQGHDRVERGQALRLAFDYARDVYGIDAHRLRGGGRAERAIKSAINSSVRQRLLERDGAMYLLVKAQFAEAAFSDGNPTAEDEQQSDEGIAVHYVPAVGATVQDAPPSSPTPAQPRPAFADRGGFVSAGEPMLSPIVAAAHAPSESYVSPVDTVGPAWAVTSPDAPTPYVEPVLAPWLTRSSDSPPSSRGTISDDGAQASREPNQAVSDSAATGARFATHEPKPLLERSLTELEFPARTLNWAESKGIGTIGQLVAWNPHDLAEQRNMGRLTLERTRAALEQALGCSWEEAWKAHEQRIPLQTAESEADEEATTAGGAMGWVAMGKSLPERHRSAPLREIDLPARMRTMVEEKGLRTLGELLALRPEYLREQPNLGRKSINDTLDAIADYLLEQQNPQQHATFLELWKAQLAGLKPIHRMILSRRSGMVGQKETLEQLGAMLGVSRERIRQLEVSTLDRLAQKSRVQREILAHLDITFGSADAIPLAVLDQEDWWRGIAEKALLLEFVFERILHNQVFLFTAPSGASFVTKFAPDAFETRVESTRSRVSKLEFPCEYASVLAIVHDEAAQLDTTLLGEFETVIARDLLRDGDGPLVLGVGVHRGDEVLAFLNAQEGPVPVSLIEEKFGRGQVPEGVLYFKRGWVGVKRHFPDFDEWQRKLVPECVAVMETRPAGRQWLIPDIHEELRTKGLVPDWLGHWHLASLLRQSDKLEYLGRLRVALRGSADERIQFEDAFVELLSEAGCPLPKDELLARARERTDVRESTALLMLKEAPFVRLDDTLIGLVERDVPGGAEAVAQAVAAVIDHLTNTEVGLTAHQAQQLIARLSDVHRGWSLPLVKSVLRSEPNLRFDRSKNVGLAEWDDARFPARAEFIRREVLRNGGQISVDGLSNQMEAAYGSRPERVQLGLLANQVGLTLDGAHIRLPQPDSAPKHAAPDPETAAQIPGIPVELQQTLTELMQEESVDAITLSGQVQAHVKAFEDEYRVNEFVELEAARRLQTQARLLLDRWPTLTPGQKRVAQAAIRYFVLVQDVEEDFDIGGLDDDERVMGAVLEHLGIAPFTPTVSP